MKLNDLLALATAIVLTQADPYDIADDMAKCRSMKHGDKAVSAITTFCNNPSIHAPSTYAQNGITNGNIHVMISGNCRPQQWIPWYWCEAQFFNMCANSQMSSVMASHEYGDNGCQHFSITTGSEY
ncbi:hypothetical protein LTR78_004804 [Recurvomyces mirabilis]|uniref:Uncharacterized protein n=1 Tax=Recurvomyces mirabilis TaxID=574656 RepID=A0AAE0WNZ9_9PEZI|nr:hypothetical protein LTR78_004804 [Recurvomyces mirabilis]KAK5157976.1 hypothetical protein LTS14_003899 [Recurvomyces mirabilis]